MAEHDPEKIAPRIKAIRKRARLSQAAMAAQLGVTPALVAQWELGKNRPGFPAVVKICEYYGVTLDFIFLGDVGTLRPAVSQEILTALSGIDRKS